MGSVTITGNRGIEERRYIVRVIWRLQHDISISWAQWLQMMNGRLWLQVKELPARKSNRTFTRSLTWNIPCWGVFLIHLENDERGFYCYAKIRASQKGRTLLNANNGRRGWGGAGRGQGSETITNLRPVDIALTIMQPAIPITALFSEESVQVVSHSFFINHY